MKRVQQAKSVSFSGQVNCLCKRNCVTRIDINRQKDIFDEYNALKRWNRKTKFLRELVVRKISDKENLNPVIQLKKKNATFSYFLIDDQGVKHQVCLHFFSKLLQIRRLKIFRAIESTDRNPSAVDHRGQNRARLAKPGDKQFIHDFIRSIPQYESKWNRSQSSTKYLHPDLNIKKLYEKYKESCNGQQQKAMSLGYFKKMFKTYDIDFAKHRTPTCWKCHELKSKAKKRIYSGDMLAKLNEKEQTHLELAKQAVNDFRKEVLSAQTTFENTEILTFGLGRPFILPSIALDHTKRHFFLYQMCVFDEVRQMTYIYTWPESVASKGTAEIASCLVLHLLANLSPNTKHLILYCDPCYGQNRNVKLSLVLQHFLHTWKNQELRSIKQIFFISGHGYNNSDRCFERVMRKKSLENIFLPSQLIHKINQPSRKVYAIEMRKEDFISTKPLEALLASKKVGVDGRKIKWSSCRSITYNRDKPFVLNIDYGHEVSVDVNLKTQNADHELSEIRLPELYPNGRFISVLKHNDLQESLTLIPTKFHDFYQALSYTDEEGFEKDYAFCARESSDEEEEEAEEECQNNN